MKTTAGPVQLSRPKLRGTTEAFASRLFGSYVTKTNAPLRTRAVTATWDDERPENVSATA